MTPEAALDEVVSIVGSMQLLADHLGVTKGAVGQWKLDDRRIPAEHCPAIERLVNGKVRCENLRPDVDWAYLRTVAQPIEQSDQLPCATSNNRKVRESKGGMRQATDPKKVLT